MPAGFVVLLACLGLHPAKASALPYWTVQSASSSLALSGALSSGGTFLASVEGQGGSGIGLTTSFSGTIVANYNPSLIEFYSATIEANTSGEWDPLPGGNTGSSSADYGGKVDLGFLGGANLAIRNLSASLSSGSLALTGDFLPFSTQAFLGNLDIAMLTATADYRGYGIVGGALGGGSLTDGIAGQSASVLTAGSVYIAPDYTFTLTLPVDFSFAAIIAGADTTEVSDDIGVFVNLLGEINATSSVPEANSLVLLGLAGSLMSFCGYRGRIRSSRPPMSVGS
jgi:hypothetical protein